VGALHEVDGHFDLVPPPTLTRSGSLASSRIGIGTSELAARSAGDATLPRAVPPVVTLIQSTNKEEISRLAREAYKSCYVKSGVVPQAASKKQDIQGIRLGMTEREANVVITPGKRPSLVFTKALEPPRICEIEHIFQSGTSPREMISIVSEQFNMTPIKADWSAEIAHATTSRLEEFTTMWGTTKVVLPLAA
jgi:hypothetical protein